MRALSRAWVLYSTSITSTGFSHTRRPSRRTSVSRPREIQALIVSSSTLASLAASAREILPSPGRGVMPESCTVIHPRT